MTHLNAFAETSEAGDPRSIQTTSRSRNVAAAGRQAEGAAESPAFTAPPLVGGCQIIASNAPAAATEARHGAFVSACPCQKVTPMVT